MASPIILSTGEPVITYGGFMGSEKILDAEKLGNLVARNDVRYFVITSNSGQQPEVNQWVTTHGTLVPDEKWQDSSNLESLNTAGNSPRKMTMQLYECHP
jgi:hypothetical protein